MLALLAAAEDYKEALEKALKLIDEYFKQAKNGTITPENAIATLSLMISPQVLCANHANSQTTIAVEKTHFKSHARENIRRKNKQERKRRAEGIPQKLPIDLSQKKYDPLESLPELTPEDLEKIKAHPDIVAARQQNITLPPPNELAAKPAPDFLPEDFDDETDEATLPPE